MALPLIYLADLLVSFAYFIPEYRVQILARTCAFMGRPVDCSL
jgi:hypothetical protein